MSCVAFSARGEPYERVRDVGPRHLRIASPELFEQRAVAVEEVLASVVEPVRRVDVHAHEVGVRPRRHPRPASDELLAGRCAGQGHDDSLARLPRLADAVAVSVVREAFVDSICEPEQGELAESSEVPDTEVVGKGRVDLLGCVDVAVRHPPAERLGAHVDELDLVRAPHDRVRNGLTLHDAGDPFHDVVE